MICSTPDIVVRELTAEDEFIVLACLSPAEDLFLCFWKNIVGGHLLYLLFFLKSQLVLEMM